MRDWPLPDDDGAHSALSAAHAILFERAKFPQYWPFPSKRGIGRSTGSAEELVVEVFGSANVAKFEVPLLRALSTAVRVATE